MRLYARLWLVVAVLLGALGVVETVLVVPPLNAVAAGTAVAAVTGLTHVCWVARDGTARARPRTTTFVAGVGALVGTTLTGLAALLGGGAVALVVLVVCSHPRFVLGAGRRLGRVLHLGDLGHRPVGAVERRAAPAPAPLPSNERGPDAAGARGLTLPELCWAWRTSFTALARADPQTEYRRWSALVAARRCYLDELARRDPAGFARWLYAGARPASDPTRYVLAVPVRRPLGRSEPA